ncbi:MAG: hypothetical protein IPO37_17765 [Saprospiraceae bacterium]|nr:hypothetical protein [Saprospiraceae bacterium]
MDNECLTLHGRISAFYDYSFNERNSFVNSQFTIGMKYQYKSNSSIILNRRIHTNRGYPEFMTSLTKGIKGILGSDFDFLKLNIGIQQTFYAQNLGTTSYHVMGGFLNKSLPLGLLYEGRGSYDKSIPFIIKDHFQTIRPYEYTHDRFVFLFMRHTFDHLFSKSKFSPFAHCTSE